MNATTSRKTPKLRHHKATGQGYVVLNRRAVYLGRYDDLEIQQKYHRLVAEWLASGRQLPADREQITVTELVARFWRHADTYYRKPDGTPTSEARTFQRILKMIRKLYGQSRAADFGPLALEAVREKMIASGMSRKAINGYVGRIKHVFKWAVSKELIPPGVYQALATVPGLKIGRSEARESQPVRPVPMDMVNAVESHVSRQVWAMIRLQLLTAARSGEIVIMRPCDIDRSGKIWVYTPADHKTAWHGHERKIYIGPEGQKVLGPFLLRSARAFCFSPAEAETERLAAVHVARVTPLAYGNRPGTNRRVNPRRKPGDAYTPESYARAITRGCDHAFPPPEALARRVDELVKEWQARLTPAEEEQLHAWRKAHRWHPHQLRHNAATNLRKEFSLEAARIILGHRSAAVTTIYAEADQQKAIEAMMKVG